MTTEGRDRANSTRRARVAFERRTASERSRTFLRLLVAILLVYTLILTFGALSFSAVVRVALLGAVLVLDARSRRRSRRSVVALSLLAAGLCLVTGVAAATASDRLLSGVDAAATLVLVALAIETIVRMLIRAGGVELSTVLGVLDVYLLLALLFASIHQLLGALQTGYLNGVEGLPTASDVLYFSVITLTTIGYGDITPGTELARAVTVMQALIGQLYLVSVVAAVVGGWRRTAHTDG